MVQRDRDVLFGQDKRSVLTGDGGGNLILTEIDTKTSKRLHEVAYGDEKVGR
jgi:hypothetical protein